MMVQTTQIAIADALEAICSASSAERTPWGIEYHPGGFHRDFSMGDID
jgi:hypothetical protein